MLMPRVVPYQMRRRPGDLAHRVAGQAGGSAGSCSEWSSSPAARVVAKDTVVGADEQCAAIALQAQHRVSCERAARHRRLDRSVCRVDPRQALGADPDRCRRVPRRRPARHDGSGCRRAAGGCMRAGRQVDQVDPARAEAEPDPARGCRPGCAWTLAVAQAVWIERRGQQRARPSGLRIGVRQAQVGGHPEIADRSCSRPRTESPGSEDGIAGVVRRCGRTCASPGRVGRARRCRRCRSTSTPCRDSSKARTVACWHRPAWPLNPGTACQLTIAVAIGRAGLAAAGPQPARRRPGAAPRSGSCSTVGGDAGRHRRAHECRCPLSRTNRPVSLPSQRLPAWSSHHAEVARRRCPARCRPWSACRWPGPGG